MLQLQRLSQLSEKIYHDLGWEWFLGQGKWKYISSDALLVKQQEQEAFYKAANELYDLFVEAGDYVIDNQLWDKLAIPKNIRELIQLTWEDERHYHLYGRFDFAGGINGLPIKLLEFNADTATTLPETAIIQWAQLKANGIPEDQQFNFVYQALVDNFKRLKGLNSDLEPTLLISAMKDAPEDDANVEVIGEAAREAGFEIEYRYVEEVVFSKTDGIFVEYDASNYRKFNFWFKLVPWEYIAYEEPELMDILTSLVKQRKAVIINPAYTLLFQSKGILPYLWQLNKHHEYLLETSFEELYRYAPYVKKPVLGREGENVIIYDQTGHPIQQKTGQYGHYPAIYQEYAEMPKDRYDRQYQAGVFFAYEGCGLGFRKSKGIVDDDAEFVGHIIS